MSVLSKPVVASTPPGAAPARPETCKPKPAALVPDSCQEANTPPVVVTGAAKKR